jgi:hypothetical protein
MVESRTLLFFRVKFNQCEIPDPHSNWFSVGFMRVLGERPPYPANVINGVGNCKFIYEYESGFNLLFSMRKVAELHFYGLD